MLFSTYPDFTVVLQSLDTGERKRLIEGDRPHYVPTGHLVFFRGSTLWAVPFDLDRGEITGTAAPVLEGAVGAVATATNGMLAYVSGSPPARRLVWVDREGREQPLGVERGGYRDLDLSPDDQRIALTITDTLGGSDVWVYDLARDTMTLAAGGPDLELYPLWTPDGESLVYASTRGEEGGRNLFRRAADGTGDVERLTTSSSQQSPWSWSLSGDVLVFQELRPETIWDIWGLSLDGSRTSEALIQTPSVDLWGAVSPDGRWLAYGTGGPGGGQTYVTPFPNTSADRWTISTDGGTEPKWASDGRELFYLTPDSVMAVSIEDEPTFNPGVPVPLFSGEYARSGGRKTWDVSTDGRSLMK